MLARLARPVLDDLDRAFHSQIGTLARHKLRSKKVIIYTPVRHAVRCVRIGPGDLSDEFVVRALTLVECQSRHGWSPMVASGFRIGKGDR